MNTFLFNNAPIGREQWLQECADLIMDEIIRPVWNVRENLEYKVSVGYAPDTKSNSRTIGVCLSAACSAEGYNEIFISPVINESLQVLATLVHELIHAVDDCKNGHKGPFVTLARKVGLDGNPTETVAGPKLTLKLKEYVALLGPIPHAKVDLSARPRQINRNIKVFCECGFKFNTSRSQIAFVLQQAGEVACPACGLTMCHPDY